MKRKGDKEVKLITEPEIKCVRKLPPADPRLIYPYGRFSEQEYLSTLVGKRIIIVGPAGYLQGQGKGSWIDSFDLVVRINHAVPVAYPEDYGSRTDILYHILSHRGDNGIHKKIVDREEIEQWKEANVKWLISSHGPNSSRVKEIGPVINGLLQWACVHDRFSANIKTQIGSRSPNTGVTAIAHLLSLYVKSLHIIGFDFYRSGVYEGYGDVRENEDALEINNRWHDVDAQIAYLKKLVKRDNRIVIDDVLKMVLANE